MIIPALDIIQGHIVRLYQGNYDKQSNYGNPIKIFKQYIQEGADTIHLIDLDGAKKPANRQTALITSLIQIASNYSLTTHIGGGIRNAQDIETLLKLGAHRVILGSAAITKPNIVKKWFKYFDPNTLILAIDVRINSNQDKKVVSHAWQNETNLHLSEVIENYNTVGLKHVLCTDTSKDGTLLGSNISLYQSICKVWPNIFFQASGGISNVTEISKLKHSGVNSVIIGRAFLEKKFTIKEAISCWQNESSHA